MNKNVVGIVLIVLAIVLAYFYGWPRLQPYLNPPDVLPGEAGETTDTAPI